MVPGDFIGVQQKMGDAAAHGVETLTDALFCVFQRDALWALRYAIRAREASAARRAVDAIDYAFRYQNKDGYFDNGHGLDAVRAIEADAFFLAAYGQFYYLADRTALRDEIRSKLLAHTAGVRAALVWLLENS